MMPRPNPRNTDLDRYARQIRYAPIGTEGQQRLCNARVMICGCGALGSVIANTLVRAGIGFLRIVDRDFLELNNLQRQVLFDERDVATNVPKAVAAAEHLRHINSRIEIEPVVTDVNHANVTGLVHDVDVILDGTDNLETRYLLNDASIHSGVPWIYGGCIGASGQTMTILPGQTPCFRCLHPDPPPPGAVETCDSAGIIGPIINVIASIQACEALKILSGQIDFVSPFLQVFDLWDNRVRQIKLDALRQSNDCPTCGQGSFPWLDGQYGSQTAVLCGRNAVQLSFPSNTSLSLKSLEQHLRDIGTVTSNRYLLRLEVDSYRITVFPDGRAIINGTEDIAEAKTIYARYVGV